MITLDFSGASPWCRRDFPDGVDALRGALAWRLHQQLIRDGAIRDACRSRVLESALAVPLLQKMGAAAPLAAVVRYLSKYRDGTGRETLEDAMARAALGKSADPEDTSLTGGYLSVLPAFLTHRKRLLFEVFGLLTGQRAEVSWDEEAFLPDGLHSWARVQMTAVKVIAACAGDRPDRVNDEDVRTLLETQRGPGIWESNVLIHLLVLHALALLPRTGSILRAGLGTLVAHQRPDGGFPFVSGTDTWTSATAGVALWSAGEPTQVLRRLAAHITERQLPGGGWSFTDHVNQSDVDCTSVAVQFLHCVSPVDYRPAIRDGLRSILAVAGSGGGFPTYIAQAPPEACMTAGCLDALSVSPVRYADRIAQGLDFLAGQQKDDGSFPLSWSRSLLHTMFRVLLVALRNDVLSSADARRMSERCLAYVIREQNKDGGWGQHPDEASDAISTAYGLICLCAQHDARPAAEAADFLLGTLQPDGTVGSIPDTLGPRPFTFAVPVLADIFVLLALGHLDQRIHRSDGRPRLTSLAGSP